MVTMIIIDKNITILLVFVVIYNFPFLYVGTWAKNTHQDMIIPYMDI